MLTKYAKKIINMITKPHISKVLDFLACQRTLMKIQTNQKRKFTESEKEGSVTGPFLSLLSLTGRCIFLFSTEKEEEDECSIYACIC